MILDNLCKPVHGNELRLALIAYLVVLHHDAHEFLPILRACFLFNFAEHGLNFILQHFCVMKLIWISIVKACLRLVLNDVLSEVKGLSGVDFRAANCIKVLVRNFTVTVQIEAVVKVIELLLGNI